ncbi:MAG: hypothetical protein COT17_01230 [Elusimicrobia bacterium CG08_land_8_20_14_0_20_51_18]|nr:MAG: hypothetical protein COT17_01230 [Elusimicrobia bacterium CG08_land_8_20_14_0_20_51_18]
MKFLYPALLVLFLLPRIYLACRLFSVPLEPRKSFLLAFLSLLTVPAAAALSIKSGLAGGCLAAALSSPGGLLFAGFLLFSAAVFFQFLPAFMMEFLLLRKRLGWPAAMAVALFSFLYSFTAISLFCFLLIAGKLPFTEFLFCKT